MLMPPLSRWHRFDLLRQTEPPTLTNGMTPGFPFTSPERWNCTPDYSDSVESGGRAVQKRKPAQGEIWKSPTSRCKKPVLWIFIFQRRVARADGIDILEEVRLLRINAEI